MIKLIFITKINVDMSQKTPAKITLTTLCFEHIETWLPKAGKNM